MWAFTISGANHGSALGDRYDVIEFYAGKARVARSARAAGMNAAALDVLFHQYPQVFDMTGAAGFSFLGCNILCCPLEVLTALPSLGNKARSSCGLGRAIRAALIHAGRLLQQLGGNLKRL